MKTLCKYRSVKGLENKTVSNSYGHGILNSNWWCVWIWIGPHSTSSYVVVGLVNINSEYCWHDVTWTVYAASLNGS